MRLTVKNWRDFQHYKDRAPPWIKLHRGLLDDADFHALPVESRALLPLLWLLAAEDDGSIKNDIRWIAFRLRQEQADIERALEPLVDAGFFYPADGDQAPKERWPSRHIPAAVRAAVMERDGNKCCACGATDNLEIDHKLPVSRGGTSAQDNLQVLCRSCNRSKRLRTAEQFATQRNAPRRTETETEGEGETEKDSHPSDVSACAAEQKPRIPPCPHEAIVEAYHEILPALPRVVVLTGKRKAHLQARWREVCAEEEFDQATGVEFFRSYFAKVGNSKFLTGKANGTGGRAPFRADFAWLINPENFAKVIEGRYA